MARSFKDRNPKSEKPLVLKNEHKASRQIKNSLTRNFSWTPYDEEEEELEFMFRPTQEDEQDAQDYYKQTNE